MMAARKRPNQSRIGNERKKKHFKQRYYSQKVFWNFIDKAVVHIC